jgi:ribose-phosphate pyrophosphokinase
MTVIGDPKGKNIIIIDDIVDTASTLCNAAGLLLASGALSVHAFCTHPVLSGEAYENIRKSSLSELVVCDTLQPDESKMSDKIKVLSVAQIFATAIRNTHEYKSINSLFINA